MRLPRRSMLGFFFLVCVLAALSSLFLTPVASGISGQVVLLTCPSAQFTPDPSCGPNETLPVAAKVLIQNGQGFAVARIDSSDGSFRANVGPGSYVLFATGKDRAGHDLVGNMTVQVRPMAFERVTLKVIPLLQRTPSCFGNLAC
jgi:hypothetical protein